MDHHHSPDEERRIRDAALDETLADSFPASDAPSTIPNPDDDVAGGVAQEQPGGADASEASRSR